MKPFHRLLQIFVMKNLIPYFGKRDVTSFMDLTYMDYLLTKKKVNLPRVIIRHMAYVINVPNHELPYGEFLTRIFEAFSVPLNYKKGEDIKRYDYFEEIFLTMCQLRIENGVWWLGSDLNRTRDDEEAEVQGEHIEKQVDKDEDSGSGEKFYDVVDDKRPVDEDIAGPAVEVSAPAIPDVAIDKQQEKAKSSGVDPSSSLTDYDLFHLQAKFARALQRNTIFQELYQPMQPKPPTSPQP
ncbi:hypothetical protein Dimus_033157 [Dionaea muscipula]